MKLLITGANGFVGSYFTDKYRDKYEIQKFSFLHDDFRALDIKGVHVVVHLAALVHQKVEQHYEKYHEINVEYPVTLAKLAKQNGVKQFVFISTIAVYGDNIEKLDEQTFCAPVTYYGKSKLEAEKQLLELNDENFTVSIIRPPMVYGKDAPGNIYSLVELVKKVPIIPLGEIHNKRSFVYVGNLCYLVDEVIGFRVKHGVTASGVFLASDDEPLSTTRLIELIAKELNKKVYLLNVPFFETLLKFLKPSFHKRLYGSLEVDNAQTKKRLFGEARVNYAISKHSLEATLPFSVEEGIKLMIHGES